MEINYQEERKKVLFIVKKLLDGNLDKIWTCSECKKLTFKARAGNPTKIIAYLRKKNTPISIRDVRRAFGLSISNFNLVLKEIEEKVELTQIKGKKKQLQAIKLKPDVE